MDTFTVGDLTFTYPGQTRPALDRVGFAVPEGAFAVIAGPSGCGKSTLLRLLKPALAPHGARSGVVRFRGEDVCTLDERRQSAEIGFVLQSPENKIVTDKVWHELAFGLESLGCDTQTIRARVAEMAGFFGIEDWFYRSVTELSGGQKQLLNLASVMAMQPRALILDEPTSQLDPIAAADFLAMIVRINRELGTTVLMTEHRLEEVLPAADSLLVLDRGRAVCSGSPREVGERLRGGGSPMFFAMPAPMRIYAAVPSQEACPLTVREGRGWLERFAAGHRLEPVPADAPEKAGAVSLKAENVWFRYEKNSPDVLRGLTLQAKKGEILALMGGNGAGKSTALSLFCGVRKPYRGTVERTGRAVLLPQDPQTVFVKNTVRADLTEVFEGGDVPKPERERRADRMLALCRLEELGGRHPYDLSGGEQQRAALAKALLLEPDILLLDEPTKGLDAGFKRELAALLRAFTSGGGTAVLVSHDIEFCAEYADRCALLFDGGAVSSGTPRTFFSGNSFYTTAVSRMARALLPRAVTCADVIRACGGEVPPPPETPDFPAPAAEPARKPAPEASAAPKLPLWRRIAAGVCGAAAVTAFLHASGAVSLPGLFGDGWAAGAVMAASLVLAALALLWNRAAEPGPRRGRLPKRTLAAAVMILLCIPLTIAAGIFWLGDRKYAFISLLVLFETMLPFFLVFEGRKPKTRELVTIAVLCALGVAGRAAFFMLPQCKPVMAVVIVAGVALGGETGFLVGAITMLVSDMFFGQGPWTPWQMFAMGLVGFLAGVLFSRGRLGRGRGTLAVFGALSAVVVYGGIVNPASALMWQSELNLPTILAYYVSGFPMDCVQAGATAVFLWLFSQPMLEKLERVKVKYGLVETPDEPAAGPGTADLRSGSAPPARPDAQ